MLGPLMIQSASVLF